MSNYVSQKTEMLYYQVHWFFGYLGFQFLLTSPSLLVPPGNPNMSNLSQFLALGKSHRWMCRVSHRRLYCAGWWCGKFLGKAAQRFDSSCYLARRNSSVCPTLSLSVVWSVVLCRVIVVASSSSACSVSSPAWQQATDVFEPQAGAKLRWRAWPKPAEDCPRSEVDPRIGRRKAKVGEA